MIFSFRRRMSLSRQPVSIAAAGSAQGDATALPQPNNRVTGADGTKGVILPVGAPGDEILVANDANAVLKVYPASGLKIGVPGTSLSAAVADAAYSLTAFGVSSFTKLDNGVWAVNKSA